ncbi:hypothetical protein EDD85DRAFT_957968 [Armillaria nabsnona]|nr:hypothetical protein EDD85DRAFT_957968 [Armillaria nabsnona]
MSDSESQPMPEDRHKAAHCLDANWFWAVLIGINAYDSSPLHGCGCWKPDMTSHIILAACEETQYAEEVPEGGDNHWNGILTQALIKALKSDGLKEESTYVDLICASKMPQNTTQRPVIVGNSSARLWYQPEMNKKVSESPWSQGSLLAWLLSGVGISVGVGVGVGVVSIACQLLHR